MAFEIEEDWAPDYHIDEGEEHDEEDDPDLLGEGLLLGQVSGALVPYSLFDVVFLCHHICVEMIFQYLSEVAQIGLVDESGADGLPYVVVVDVTPVGEIIDSDGRMVVHVVLSGPLMVSIQYFVVRILVTLPFKRIFITFFHFLSQLFI